MPNRIKELMEQRGAKLRELEALNARPATEKRALTAEETAKFDGLEAEIRQIDATVEREHRAAAIAGAKPAELSEGQERDLNKFDWGRAIRGLIGAEKIEGIEKEMHEEGIREARTAQVAVKGRDSLVLPSCLLRRQDRTRRRFGRRMETRTDLVAGTATSGGDTIATTPEGLLDSFYNAMIIEDVGATILEGLVGNIPLPRYIKASDPSTQAENATASHLVPTTAAPTLSPHRLPAYTDLSEQLLMQSSAAIEAVVRRNIALQLAAKMQQLCINGQGSSSDPNGLLSMAGAGSTSYWGLTQYYAGGAGTTSGTNANGAAQLFADWVNLETGVTSQDVPEDALSYLTNAKVRGQAKQTRRGLTSAGNTITDSNMIWERGNEVNGRPAFVTNGVPSNNTKGSSSTLSSLAFGMFSDWYIGLWAGLALELLRDATLATTGTYRLVGSLYFDTAVVRPQSIAFMSDIAA